MPRATAIVMALSLNETFSTGVLLLDPSWLRSWVRRILRTTKCKTGINVLPYISTHNPQNIEAFTIIHENLPLLRYIPLAVPLIDLVSRTSEKLLIHYSLS